MANLLVMLPTRGRRAQCERLLESFRETASPGTELVAILDPDDQETYSGLDWGPAATAVLDPRGSTIEKLNMVAMECAGGYDALYFVSDDQVFKTPHWDTVMMGVLEHDLGGHGWVYPEDRRRSDIPEHYLVDTELVAELGWYANPALKHFYMADTVAVLGRKTGMLRFCPEVVVEHHRYTTDPSVAHDETYRYAEREWGQRDLEAFKAWAADLMPNEVARLRRRFSRDIEWVTGLIADPVPAKTAAA